MTKIDKTKLKLLGAAAALGFLISLADYAEGELYLKSRDLIEYKQLSKLMTNKTAELAGLGVDKITPAHGNNLFTGDILIRGEPCEGNYSINNNFGPFSAISRDGINWIVYADKSLKSKNTPDEAEAKFAQALDDIIILCQKSVENQKIWAE